MKNILLSFALVLSFLFSFSQPIDTTSGMWNELRFTDWIKWKRATFPTGIENDSIFGAIIDGQMWVNKGYRSGVVDAMSVGLFSDGADKTSLANRLANNRRIKQINIGSQNQADIIINGTVDFKNIILNFVDSTKFNGTGTIVGGIIDAPLYKQLFGHNQTVRPFGSRSGVFQFDWFISPDTTLLLRNKVFNLLAHLGPKGLGHLRLGSRVYNFDILPTGSGNNLVVFPLFWSDMSVIGEGMFKTIVRADWASLRNFQRMFYIGNDTLSIRNIRVESLQVDMQSPWTTYESAVTNMAIKNPGAVDVQATGFRIAVNAGIPYTIRDVDINNVYIKRTPGDLVQVARNAGDIRMKTIRYSDYNRQGIQIGGEGTVNGVFVDDLKYFPDEFMTNRGGDCFHVEHSYGGKGIALVNSSVLSMSGSHVSSMYVNNVDIKGGERLVGEAESQFNNVYGNVTFTNIVADSAVIAFSFMQGATATIDNVSARYLALRTSSGGNKHTGGVTVSNSRFSNSRNDDNPVVVLNNINNVMLDNVNVTQIKNNKSAIRIANSDSTTLKNVTATAKSTTEGTIYAIASLNTSRGARLSIEEGNIYHPTGRGVWVNSMALYTNGANIDAPTPIHVIGVGAKTLPVQYIDKGILRVKTFPNYGKYAIGDEILVTSTSSTSPTTYRCYRAGGLAEEDWSAGSTYYVNSYVRDAANNRYYRSRIAGGQAEQPSLDTDTTYWEQVGTQLALFESIDAVKRIYSVLRSDSVFFRMDSAGVFVGESFQYVLPNSGGGESFWAAYPGAGNVENINTATTRLNGLFVQRPRVGTGIFSQILDNGGRLFEQGSIDSSAGILQYRTGNGLRVRWMGYDGSGVLGTNMTFNNNGLRIGSHLGAERILDITGFARMRASELPSASITNGDFGVDVADGLWKFRQNGTWATLGGGGGGGITGTEGQFAVATGTDVFAGSTRLFLGETGVEIRNSSGGPVFMADGNKAQAHGSIPLSWGVSNATSATDLALWKDAANTMSQRNGNNTQEYRLYRMYSGANTEWLALSAKLKANTFTIASRQTGTGTERNIELIAPQVRADNFNINGAYSFPVTDGTSGQVLKTDGAGTLAWQDDTGGGGGGSGTVNSGTQYRLAYYAATGTAVSQHAALTANRVLLSDANGLPFASTVTNTQLASALTPETVSILKTQYGKLRLTIAGNSTEIALADSGHIVENTNYSFADNNNAVVIAKATAVRNITLPIATSYPDREIFLKNETDTRHVLSSTIQHDSSYHSAYLNPQSWIIAKSTLYPGGGYRWVALNTGAVGEPGVNMIYSPSFRESTPVLSGFAGGTIRYTKEGNVVSMWGRFTVTPGTSGKQDFVISLPENDSTFFVTPGDLSGAATAGSTSEIVACQVLPAAAPGGGGVRFQFYGTASTIYTIRFYANYLKRM